MIVNPIEVSVDIQLPLNSNGNVLLNLQNLPDTLLSLGHFFLSVIQFSTTVSGAANSLS